MKYYKQEHEPLLEMLVFRNARCEDFLLEEKVLNEKKESLFRSKDIGKWQFEGDMIELIGRKHDLIEDRKKAFPFIMSKETK